MEFSVLGSLEIADEGRPVQVTGRRRRTLLAVLLVHANEVVSSDRLIDALWGDAPPDTARTALQVHVSRLRKLLGADRIDTRAPGYVLRAAPDELDLLGFERLLGDDRVAEALALWRGPPLAEFQYEPFAAAHIARLEELHLAARERAFDLDLEAGRHHELVPDLEALVRQQPLRERPPAQLMLALYRCGRQADALDVYRRTRRALVEELGIDPAAELQELERRILNQDPALDLPATAPSPPHAEPREERRVVSVLFAELAGVPALDPEDVGALLSRYHVRLRAELERHGGTVERLAGDAALAIFGAPVAHEDDPERAVRAALAIRDWIAEQEELEVRVAVNTGEALVRLDPARGAAIAAGEVASVAGRLGRLAPRNAAVVGEATHRATEPAIAYEPLRPNGETVLWLAKEPEPAPVTRASAPFVGRQAELALLERASERGVRESSVQLVTVVGEAGVGKTRLLAELRTRAGGQLWLTGRCLSYGEGITFWAFGEMVKQIAGILEGDPSEDALGKLAAAVEAVVEDPSEREWISGRLRPLIGADEAATERTESFAAWRTFLERLARSRPVVVHFEDLHWADPALLEFVDHLVDCSAGVPLLVAGTARPELFDRAPGWGGGKRNSTTLALAPLSEDETASLVRALLDEAPPPALEARLLERAAGNPLFAEELVRMLAEQAPDPARDDIPVPDSVHTLIAARLDTLPPEQRELLLDAAVVGKVFWAGALASMSGLPREAALGSLHDLVRRELVRRAAVSTVADDVEYTFWHVLVRDVAYGQIPRAGRADRHVAAAHWIERVAGERARDHAEFLAHHYATALELLQASAADSDSVAERAAEWLVLAGDRAVRLDPARGESYFRRALAIVPGGDRSGPAILAKAADAALLTGARDLAEIRADLEDAASRLRAQGDEVAAADAITRLAYLLWPLGEDPAERELLDDAARELLEQHEPTPELALLYAQIALHKILELRSDECLEWADRALPLLEQFGLRDDALQTRSRRALALASQDPPAGVEEGRAVLEEALDPARAYTTRTMQLAAINVAAVELAFGDGPGAALELERLAVDLGMRRGLERASIWAHAFEVELLWELGSWDEILQVANDVDEWDRKHPGSAAGVLPGPWKARVLVARGDVPGGVAVAADAVERAPDAQTLLPALVAAATAEHAAGRGEHAREHVDEFVRRMLARPPAERALELAGMARVCLAIGALEPLARLMKTLQGRGRLSELQEVSGRAALAEGRDEPDEAAALYGAAATGWAAYGSRVEEAYALLGLARCGSDPDADMRARALFTAFGAVRPT